MKRLNPHFLLRVLRWATIAVAALFFIEILIGLLVGMSLQSFLWELFFFASIVIGLIGDTTTKRRRSTAGRVNRYAKYFTGYNGPSLQFPKQWKPPSELNNGELTCIGAGAIVRHNGEYIILTSRVAHIWSSFRFVVWKHNNTLYAAAINPRHRTLMPRGLQVGDDIADALQVVYHATCITGAWSCPHTTGKY